MVINAWAQTFNPEFFNLPKLHDLNSSQLDELQFTTSPLQSVSDHWIRDPCSEQHSCPKLKAYGCDDGHISKSKTSSSSSAFILGRKQISKTTKKTLLSSIFSTFFLPSGWLNCWALNENLCPGGVTVRRSLVGECWVPQLTWTFVQINGSTL